MLQGCKKPETGFYIIYYIMDTRHRFYVSHKTITNVHNFRKTLPFPAVTVYNNNKLSKSRILGSPYEEIIKVDDMMKYAPDHINKQVSFDNVIFDMIWYDDEDDDDNNDDDDGWGGGGGGCGGGDGDDGGGGGGGDGGDDDDDDDDDDTIYTIYTLLYILYQHIDHSKFPYECILYMWKKTSTISLTRDPFTSIIYLGFD